MWVWSVAGSRLGEILLVHCGIFFLDEFLEFGTRMLEVIDQPMEDKVVTISCAQGSLTFSATKPCPCSYYGDIQKPKQLSGPLLDRIDIHIEVPSVDYQKLSSDRLGESLKSAGCSRYSNQTIFDRRGSNAQISNIACNVDMRIR